MNKHIILTNGRSGSNYFSALLNLHPQVTNYGEVLGEWTLSYKIYNKLGKSRMSPDSYLDYIYNSKLFFTLAQIYSAYSKIKKKEKINFKVYNQIKSIGIKDFTVNFFKRNIENYLSSRKDIYVINLYRNNSLARITSIKAMKASGIVKTVKKVGKIKFYLDPDELLDKLKIYEKEKNDQFELIKTLPQEQTLSISYEEYFASEESQKTFNQKIFELLEVPPIDIKSNQKKILSRNLSNTVENYEEIANLLRKTPYEKYLF